MLSSKKILISLLLICLGLLGVALYLQLVENMLPCPLCVAQRYAFIGVALCCLLALILPDLARRTLIALGVGSAGYGASVAIEHLHVLANPSSSCGIDPLEVALNKMPFAEWLPVMFQANGICGTPYPPILGLSIPAWALVWFIISMLALSYAFIQQTPRGMFGKRR
jgi:protein dithiol:quinone oxidoreductase